MLIIAIAVLVRLSGLNLELLSPAQKASVILSVSMGISSVIGLYFLAKELFDEKLAAISSFLLAVSFWHILVSKIGAKDIFTSFAFIFAFYFIWHGLKYGHKFDFFLAGLFWGAGFYVGWIYFVAPLVTLLVFWNYWDYIKKDFSLSKYEHTKKEVLGGFSLLAITVIATVLPIELYVWQNPGFILSADNLIFSSVEPLPQFYNNLKWVADKLLLIKFDGGPVTHWFGSLSRSSGNLLSWPMIIFFAIGSIKELVHWLKRKHGHFSVVHTFIFSWLLIMPIPVLMSAEPSVLELSIILPPIMILSAKGVWWVIEKLNKWEHLVYPRPHKHYAGLDAGPFLALVALLISIAILEISKTI